MQEVSFEDALEILTIKDPRYPREAYLFVREALDHTQRALAKDRQGSIRHVSGQELLGGIKDLESFATRLGNRADALSAFLWDNLTKATQVKLEADPATAETREMLT